MSEERRIYQENIQRKLINYLLIMNMNIMKHHFIKIQVIVN